MVLCECSGSRYGFDRRSSHLAQGTGEYTPLILGAFERSVYQRTVLFEVTELLKASCTAAGYRVIVKLSCPFGLEVPFLFSSVFLTYFADTPSVILILSVSLSILSFLCVIG